jgi:HK97 gp10 family phage protein
MEISFRVEGLQHLQRKLETIKNLERDPRVNQLLGRGAAHIQSAVKLLTPVDTGNLKNKIIAQQEKFMQWVVETNVEYAIFVEFGTGKLGSASVPHTNKESWTYYSEKLKRFVTTHGQKPASMFRDGFIQSYRQAYQIIKVEVEEIIRNA